MAPTRSEFIATVRRAVAAAMPGASSSTVDLVTAHAGFETGWGTSKAFLGGNNLFNITRVPGDTAPVIVGPDTEYGPTGAPKKITQRFAAYSSPQESVEHYLKFIDGPRYRPAKEELLDGDYLGFLTSLGKGGYFTLPLAQYIERFAGALETVQAEVTDFASGGGSSSSGSASLSALIWIAVLGGSVVAGYLYLRS